MNSNLTDRNYWKTYWLNYEYRKVPQKMFFDKYIPTLTDGKSFIEIGGFPGTMPVYFHKKYKSTVSLLDFYIDKEMVTKLETANNIAQGSIECIESDFFAFDTEKRYDTVFSLGFIEHFANTHDVIKRHIDLLASDGNLLIILPNFLGLNGWIQCRFDRENFEAHNLKSMEIPRLKEIMQQFDLSAVHVEYTRKPMVWLEPKTSASPFLRKAVKLLSYALKMFPIKSRFLSPYIVISAKKY
ncbi:MAG: class I SAM-dependent methyltransferase [Bacteroidales bacterium]|jgi:SAM-dependent methyltransferase|nr:class I SAM-dependent methyltransferase [Bacteroidales bacterium]